MLGVHSLAYALIVGLVTVLLAFRPRGLPDERIVHWLRFRKFIRT